MFIEKNENGEVIITTGGSLKSDLVKYICRKDNRYNDKALYTLDNVTLEKIKKLTVEGVFVAYVEINYRLKNIVQKSLNLSNIERFVTLREDGKIKFNK
jgi:hypothetical protein